MKFALYLADTDIAFVMDSDCGAPRITMTIPLPDSAVGCIESCIWFFKHEAEVRTYYPKPVAEICEESEHKGELLRLLNFFNARVYPDQTDGGAGSAEHSSTIRSGTQFLRSTITSSTTARRYLAILRRTL